MATQKDISKYLLDYYQIDYTLVEKPGKSLFSKVRVLICNTIRCINFIRENKIDLIISRISPYLALSGFLLRKPHVILADTESAGIYAKFFVKFVNLVITAQSYRRRLCRKQVKFDGNIELMYLHANRFQPDVSIVDLLGIKPGELYVIMRFVSWDAYHDKGLSGFTDANKIKAVRSFEKYARVFISAEKELPPQLERFHIKIPPERMHDALAHAALFLGESSTMASESAVLGTPAIYLNKNWLGYTDEEQEYGLVFNFKDTAEEQDAAITKGEALLSNPETEAIMAKNKQALLKEKIDVTAFIAWLVHNYPGSAERLQKNPDYQYNFR